MCEVINLIKCSSGKKAIEVENVGFSYEVFNIKKNIMLGYINNTQNYIEYIEILLNNLPEKMFNYYNKASNLQDKINSLLSYYMLNSLLEKQNDLILNFSTNGKPYLDNGKFISISHTQNIVLCAVSTKMIGIDIEKTFVYNDKIANYIANDIEYNKLLKSKNKDKMLSSLWTKKESYIKCYDLNLSYSMKNIDTINSNCTFCEFQFENDICGAFCQTENNI